MSLSVTVYGLHQGQRSHALLNPVTVPGDSSFLRIRELVAERCRVPLNNVDVYRHTTEGPCRVRPRAMQEVGWVSSVDAGILSFAACLVGREIMSVSTIVQCFRI